MNKHQIVVGCKYQSLSGQVKLVTKLRHSGHIVEFVVIEGVHSGTYGTAWVSSFTKWAIKEVKP
jgi:hypothetical protein